jgi:branched-chain amino acid aminotransferase
MAQSEGVMFINGEFYPASEGKIPVLDAGFWMGINIFDTLSARQGYIFKVRAHVDRFYRSAHAIRIDIPYTKEEMSQLIVETTRRSGLMDAYIQCIATRGFRSPAPIDQWKPGTIVYAIPYFTVVPQKAIDEGAKIRIASIRNVGIHSVDAKIKNFNRLHRYLARLEAIDSGADDAIMLDAEGYVTEGRGANVFAATGKTLYTPSEGMLPGITRETVFEIADREGIPWREVRMTPYDLYNADEVFYATTAGAIIPITDVDRRKIGAGRPGAITARLSKIYQQMHVDPKYSTPVYGAAPAS